MTTILALETSRSLCSVAVQKNAELVEDTRKVERLHNEVVLGMIDEVCARSGVSRRAIDVVAFGGGPGSFTGVRIAAAVAQGIAFGADARMVSVASSLAMAQAALRQLAYTPEGLITMTRSRRDAYYLAGFSVQGNEILLQLEDRLCTAWPAEFLRPGWVAVGDQPPWWAAGAETVKWGGALDVTAGVIAELGLAAYAAGDAVDPGGGLPKYVLGDSPWVSEKQDGG